MKYTKIDNVVLIGTSHIARESVKNVAAVIKHFAEEHSVVVGVELDKYRFRALLDNRRRSYMPTLQNVRMFGVTGTIFALLAGYVSDKLGKHVGAKPGDDMLSAIFTAKKLDLTIALVDQPVQITLRRFSQAITWREKGRFVWDIVQGLFFPRRVLKMYGVENFDLTKVPSDKIITQLIAHMQKRYPNVYRVLIDERNKYMVRKIRKFEKKYPDDLILAVIGAGHEEGMRVLLGSVR
jgi:pheromone shutdown protein TraB